MKKLCNWWSWHFGGLARQRFETAWQRIVALEQQNSKMAAALLAQQNTIAEREKEVNAAISKHAAQLYDLTSELHILRNKVSVEKKNRELVGNTALAKLQTEFAEFYAGLPRIENQLRVLYEEVSPQVVSLENRANAAAGLLALQQKALCDLSTEVNDLRNKLAEQPPASPAPVRRVARTFSEFRHAAERAPKGKS